MERLTTRYPNGAIGVGQPLRGYNYDDIKEVLGRLAEIEDILGNDYDLDRIRELAKAGKKIDTLLKLKSFCESKANAWKENRDPYAAGVRDAMETVCAWLDNAQAGEDHDA